MECVVGVALQRDVYVVGVVKYRGAARVLMIMNKQDANDEVENPSFNP